LLYQKKKLVMATLLGVEMRSLGHQFVPAGRQAIATAREPVAPATLTQALV